MKSLALYVDKWYLIGAVCVDGVPRLIRLPNREDRFWLYFYEDIANDQIIYGKDNQSHYRDKELHYYGDIFSKLADPRQYFTIYGRQRELRDIFEVSGIFNHIKKEMDMDKDITTFVSFSPDITDVARKAFLDILAENGFVVKESVARIGHLALEYGCRHGYFRESGDYLVLDACNENLHYSVFKHEGNYFNRLAESVLLGMGTDQRGRALIETVVESVNNRLHFLSSQAEINDECLRMCQFVDDWLLRLANAKSGIPISIPNVFFSGHKANACSVSIVKKKIDDRTSVIVDDIIRVISEFIRRLNIRIDEIKGILFLGNTFTNAQFESRISERFLADHIVKYKESELPNIVGVYSVLDCSQFSDATTLFEQSAEAEALRLKNAREEEERKKQAAAEQEKAATAEREAHEADVRYQTYMEAAAECERQQDYMGMQDNCRDALAVRPDDPEAAQKLQDAIRMAAEEAATAKQYNSIIQRAKQSFDKKQWNEAKAQAENALNIKPSSREAQRLYDESKNHLAIESRISEYLTRADLFEAQKSYAEAVAELKKALSLDESNAAAAERLHGLKQRQEEFLGKLQDLKTQLQSAEQAERLDTAVEICNQLADMDSSNLRKWSEKAQQLQNKIRETEQRKQRLQQLRSDIDTAFFDEDWTQVAMLCENALKIDDAEDLRCKLEKARAKIQAANLQRDEENKKRRFESKVAEIKTLIADQHLASAKKALQAIQSEQPDFAAVYKDLWQRIFVAEEQRTETLHRSATASKPKRSISDDDFFGIKKPQNSVRNVMPESKTTTSPTGDDFFDMDISGKKSGNIKDTRKPDTDFDF